MSLKRKKRSLVETKDEDSQNSASSREDVIIKDGAIVRITMERFVTYTRAELIPGSNLNVILGPNGTGKSTVVAAIVLGVGGGVDVLGRGKSPADFIKHGYSDAYIETELYHHEGNIILSRRIKKEGSTWKINGRVVNKKDIEDLTKQLNIQVDNLCQFLPQDKVASFSSMNSIQLLKETQKAVGGMELLSLHEKLIEMKREKSKNDTDFASLQKEIDHLKEQNKILERSVERFREKEKCLEHIDYLSKKRLWCSFSKKLLEVESAKEEHTKLSQEYQAFEAKEIGTTKKKLQKVLKEIEQLDQKTKENMSELPTLDTTINRIKTTNSEKLVKIDNLNETCESIRSEIEEKDRRIKSLERELASYEAKLQSLIAKEKENIQEEISLNEEFKQISDCIADLKYNRQLIEAELRDLTAKQLQYKKNKQSRDEHIRRLLYQLPEPIKRTYDWINSNRDKFQDKVFGPVVLEISTNKALHSKYLDTLIGKQYKEAFIVSNVADRALILRLLKQLSITATVLLAPKKKVLEHPVDISVLKNFGVTHYADEIFEADPYVKFVICSITHLHQIVIGDQIILEKVREYVDKGIGTAITPNSLYISKRSVFSRKVSTVIRDISQRTLHYSFTSAFDEQEYSTRNIELMESITALQQKINGMDEEIATLDLKVKANRDRLTILRSRENPKRYETLIRDKKKVLEETKGENLEDKLETALKTIKKIKMEMFISSNQLLSSSTMIAQKTFEQCRLAVEREFKRKLRDLFDAEIQQAQFKLEDMRKKIEECYIKHQRLRGEAKALKTEAERQAPKTAEILERFRTYPDDIEEIENLINIYRATADECFTNKEEVERYEERRRKIDELTEKMKGEGAKIGNWQAEIDRYKEKWLPQIEEITKGIASKFSVFFEGIGCVGDVKLHKEEGDDFENFGLEIWVTYRANEPLKKLSAQVQSGGERSVATMLYLIALQHLSQCPFRLVDEINQGMDPHNERMIFDLIATQASLENTPQYFLITPKLLPNLTFLENITVLCVLNGPWQPESVSFKAM